MQLKNFVEDFSVDSQRLSYLVTYKRFLFSTENPLIPTLKASSHFVAF